jgi:hypothetical protein
VSDQSIGGSNTAPTLPDEYSVKDLAVEHAFYFHLPSGEFRASGSCAAASSAASGTSSPPLAAAVERPNPGTRKRSTTLV